jgi:hypothetical protein
MAKRHEFPKPTVRLLAARVGYHCSNPDCRALTSGPDWTATKEVNVGEAAHITAAAPGGPRYDASLAEDQRRHYDNGIWLCGIHARQIDVDPDRFPVSLLREWKKEAEAEALTDLGRPRVPTESEFAVSSAAERLGASSSVLVEGVPTPSTYIFDPDEDGLPPTWFVSGFVVRSSIRKREELARAVIEYVQATVHETLPIPAYKPLYQVFPAHTSLYYIELEPNTSNAPRVCRPQRYYEATSPQTADLQFPPTLVLDDPVPAQIAVRLNAKSPGMYLVSIEAIISSGSRQEVHTLMQPQYVIFEKPEDP